MVLETLEPMEKDRKAWHLIGGTLTEQTVGEVMPAVTVNRDNVCVGESGLAWRHLNLHARAQVLEHHASDHCHHRAAIQAVG